MWYMRRKIYPSDVSDDEWAFVAPYLTLLPEEAGDGARRGGAKRLMLTHLPVDGDGSWASTAASDAFGREAEIAEPARTYEI